MGGVPVTSELLVTSVAVRGATSLPWMSWTALASLESDGSVGSDGLVVFDGVVEGELNGVSVDGNSGDGVG